MNLNRNLSDLSKLRDQSKMCHLAQPDVFFLVDMSRTVTKDEENLPLIFGFIKEFIKEFTISRKDAQFGLATFANQFKVIFNLNEFKTKQDIFKWVSDSIDLVDLGKGTVENFSAILRNFPVYFIIKHFFHN